VSEYLVTGGAGFIGSHIAAALLAEGHGVRVFDNFSTGHRANVEFGGAGKRLRVIEGDVRDPKAVEEAAAGVTGIYHEAALPSVQRSVDDPATTHSVNADGTINALEAARRQGVKRFVYAGSSSVYGDNPSLPKSEEMLPAPMSPYAVSKLVGEYYCRVYAHLYGIQTVTLRYFNVFGPRQDPDSPYAAVIPLFVQALAAGRRPKIYGDGLQSRDFTYIDNVVRANLLAMKAEGLRGEVLNVAMGERVSLLEMLKALEGIIGRPANPEHAPARAGDVKHSLADISRARQVLGYEPGIRLEEGLRRTVEHLMPAGGKRPER